MTEVIVESIHNDFGAQILNLDLSTNLKGENIKTILKAIDDFSFLIFPDQSLEDESHLEFTKLLGTPEPNHVAEGRDFESQGFRGLENCCVGLNTYLGAVDR